MQIKEIEDKFTEINRKRNAVRQMKDPGVKAETRSQIARDLKTIKAQIAEHKKKLKKDEKKRAEYLKLLTVERQRKIISVPDEYELNAAEYEEVKKMVEAGKDSCGRARNIVKMASGWDVEVNDIVYYTYSFDATRGQNLYVIYIEVVKAPEDQIGRDLAWNIQNGYKPSRDEYPPEKVQIRRREISETQFKTYFEEEV